MYCTAGNLQNYDCGDANGNDESDVWCGAAGWGRGGAGVMGVEAGWVDDINGNSDREKRDDVRAECNGNDGGGVVVVVVGGGVFFILVVAVVLWFVCDGNVCSSVSVIMCYCVLCDGDGVIKD